MKLSDYVIDFLVSSGVTHIFEVAGGSLAHLLDSLYGRKDILTVSMHHEQAAAMAAEGYARTKGGIGVAMATSGPGATNLITGIGSCFFDSIPALFITGQVNTYEFKFNKPVRQMGFQETDIVNIVRPIVKDAMLVNEPEQIKYCLERCLYLAMTGRPGPVLLDIPLNVQRADIDASTLKPFFEDSTGVLNTNLDEVVGQVLELINSSVRPIVLVGGGVRLAKCCDNLFEFIHKTGIPVVASLMGLDAFPHEDPAFVGMIGTYGNRYANLAIANSDLVLALGTRFDTRQTGTRPDTFARGARIVHVDIDPWELNNKIRTDLSVNCDLKKFLVSMNNNIGKDNYEKLESWKKIIKHYKEKYPSYNIPAGDAIDPNFFMHILSRYLPENAVVCTDIGQNQMWAAQSLEIKQHQRFLTEGGMAAMGSAMPMAIGASFAKPTSNMVVITGDGGFQLNIQDLQTIFHHQLPIKIVLINNSCYGMVRQFQKQYFGSRFQSTVVGYSAPDFQSVVAAYKIPVYKARKKEDIEKALRLLFADRTPSFLEVVVDQNAEALPKLPVGKPIEEQEPPLSREELKSVMVIDPLEDNEE
jgi:acetolactate synthase-1/2/3 large subunit